MNLKVIRKRVEKARRNIKAILRHPLTQKNKVSALARYLGFHIRGAIVPGLRPYPYIGDVSFLAQPGMAGIVGNIYMGLEDFEEQGFLLHFLRPNDLFVDVGANVGAYTLLASGYCNAKSVAFEPVPVTIDILKRNIERNQLGDYVELLNIGISSQKGVLRFTKKLDVLNHVIYNGISTLSQDETIDICVFTLDEILQDRQPALIKIDVEGYELPVLQGSKSVLASPDLQAIVIELDDKSGIGDFSREEAHELLSGHGFNPYKYSPFTRELHKLTTRNKKFNTIYLRDVDFILNRLKTSKPFSILNQLI